MSDAPDALTCQERLTAYDELAKGQRNFHPEALRRGWDAQTQADLRVGQTLFPVFGRRIRTEFGKSRLLSVLTHPYLDVPEILERQEAIRDLMKDSSVRSEVQAAFERLPARGSSGRGEDWMVDNLGQDAYFPLTAGISVALKSLGTFTGAVAGWGAGVQFMGIALLASGQNVTLAQRARVRLEAYKGLLELAQELANPLSRSPSKALQRIGDRFRALTDPAHPESLVPLRERLQRKRSNRAMIVPDFLWEHGLWTSYFTDKEIRGHRESLSKVFSAIAELDVFQAMAEVTRAHSVSHHFPVLLDQEEPVLKIRNGHNPYLAYQEGRRSEANDLQLQYLAVDPSAQNFMILTGPNTGGKSTYLRMAGWLVILALAGAPVPVESMELTPLEILTNIDIADSLEKGVSFFDAETTRMLDLIHAAEKKRKVLYLMDEILLGTNPLEREAAVREIIRYFSGFPNLYLLATHDQRITELSSEMPRVLNFHVKDPEIGGYRVFPGPADSRNGLRILEQKGYPKSILDGARRYLDVLEGGAGG